VEINDEEEKDLILYFKRRPAISSENGERRERGRSLAQNLSSVG